MGCFIYICQFVSFLKETVYKVSGSICLYVCTS